MLLIIPLIIGVLLMVADFSVPIALTTCANWVATPGVISNLAAELISTYPIMLPYSVLKILIFFGVWCLIKICLNLVSSKSVFLVFVFVLSSLSSEIYAYAL